MKSTAKVLSRISLALLFCLAMFITANPAVSGQRDRGGRRHCEKECQDRYKEQIRECRDKRGRDRRECQRHAEKDRNECRDKCRH